MIRIVSDSAADFSLEELSALNIACCPMQITFGDEAFADGVELTADAFWARLMSGENPKTSQPSPEVFLSVFEEAVRAGDEVVCVLVSSALSGTLQSATIACSMMDNPPVYIVDSLSVAAGEQLLVRRACRLRDEGTLSAGDIARDLNAYKSRIRLYAAVDTLEYLARGGRIPKAAASLGSLVKLKPILTISEDGLVEMAGKGLGAHRAMQAMISLIKAHDIDESEPCLPLYAYSRENAELFAGKLNQAGVSCSADQAVAIGSTIGTHAGPNAYGVVFVEKAR